MARSAATKSPRVKKPEEPSSGSGRRRAAARDEGGAAYQQRLEEIKLAAADLFRREGFRGLRALVTALMRSYSDNYPLLYVFIQENLSHVSHARSEWSQEMRAINKSYEDILVSVIQGGLDDGSIRPIAEAWVLAYGVIGMVGWTNRWFNPDETPADATVIGTAFADVLLTGMEYKAQSATKLVDRSQPTVAPAPGAANPSDARAPDAHR